MPTQRYDDALPLKVTQLANLGQDLNGELYAVSHAGIVYRITPG